LKTFGPLQLPDAVQDVALLDVHVSVASVLLGIAMSPPVIPFPEAVKVSVGAGGGGEEQETEIIVGSATEMGLHPNTPQQLSYAWIHTVYVLPGIVSKEREDPETSPQKSGLVAGHLPVQGVVGSSMRNA
jgi:hypothetical protein